MRATTLRLRIVVLLVAVLIVVGLLPQSSSASSRTSAVPDGSVAPRATPVGTSMPTIAAQHALRRSPAPHAPRQSVALSSPSPASSGGVITTIAGNGTLGQPGNDGDGGPATAAALNTPSDVAVDQLGNVYILDAGSNVVRKVAAGTGTISTYAGLLPGAAICAAATDAVGDGCPATQASLNVALYNGGAIATDAAGDLFIADTQDNLVREVSAATGIVTVVAGTGYQCDTYGGTCYNGDNRPAVAAMLHHPWGLALDSSGNLYIDDLDNQAIREVHALPGGGFDATSLITTVAGVPGVGGYGGDGGPATAALLLQPRAGDRRREQSLHLRSSERPHSQGHGEHRDYHDRCRQRHPGLRRGRAACH